MALYSHHWSLNLKETCHEIALINCLSLIHTRLLGKYRLPNWHSQGGISQHDHSAKVAHHSHALQTEKLRF